MRQKLLPSGRVRYMPMTDHLGGGLVRSLLTGAESRVDVRRRTVDATYYGTGVPSTRKPLYHVAPGVRLVTPNALPRFATSGGAASRFDLVGAGKTAMDVAVWLLGAGVMPDGISWVVPRNSWLLNRRTTQPGMEFFHDSIGAQATQMESFAASSSTDDVFATLEA